MSLEIEAKLKVDSHEAVRARLIALGAQRIGRFRENNHIFDNAERSLLSGDKGLRVRESAVHEGSPPPATLTYKGPRNTGPFKSRPEIEVEVSDADRTVELIESLGFEEVVSFEKCRESWKLGPCRIELDRLPHLGCYVEIEGPDEEAVRHCQETLDLANILHEPESYIALLVRHCQAHSLPTRPIPLED